MHESIDCSPPELSLQRPPAQAPLICLVAAAVCVHPEPRRRATKSSAPQSQNGAMSALSNAVTLGLELRTSFGAAGN
jgi:hypothetical protein